MEKIPTKRMIDKMKGNIEKTNPIERDLQNIESMEPKKKQEEDTDYASIIIIIIINSIQYQVLL